MVPEVLHYSNVRVSQGRGWRGHSQTGITALASSREVGLSGVLVIAEASSETGRRVCTLAPQETRRVCESA